MSARLTLKNGNAAIGMRQKMQQPRLRSSTASLSRPAGALRAPIAPRIAVASAGGLAHPGEEGKREGSEAFDSAMRVPASMARGFGSSGGATLQRSKLDMAQKVQQTAPKIDEGGGGGGIGGKIFNGGGGGDDGGDDDDYFDDDFGEEGDGDGDGNFFRVALPELYDQITLNAVLAEWFRTVADLPLVLRQVNRGMSIADLLSKLQS